MGKVVTGLESRSVTAHEVSNNNTIGTGEGKVKRVKITVTEDCEDVIEGVGFEFKRQKGSHMVYSNPDISERMVIQKHGLKAKSYQVRQLRDIINKHGL